MARQTLVVTIASDGRDHGKVFHIKEMPASQAENWAMRLLMALARGNVDVPEGFFGMGWQAIALLGIRGLGGVPWNDAKPLMDEMMACISFQPGSNPSVLRPLIEDDIEEVRTRLKLREDWISLHLGFSLRDRLSTSIAESSRTDPPTPNIETSPGQLPH
jgi:hypothetical protein